MWTRLFTKQLLNMITVIFELPPSVMKSSDCSFIFFCLIKLSPVFLRRRRWKKLAGVSTQRIPKTNTTPSCYYRWPDRRVRREATSQEDLSNYRFSDAVTGWRIDCKAELLIPSLLPSFLACFLPHLPVKQPTSCHHFAMLVRLQLSARRTACREAAAAIRHRALERLWLCAHKTQPPAHSLRNQDLEKSSAGTKRTKRCKRQQKTQRHPRPTLYLVLSVIGMKV